MSQNDALPTPSLQIQYFRPDPKTDLTPLIRFHAFGFLLLCLLCGACSPSSNQADEVETGVPASKPLSIDSFALNQPDSCMGSSWVWDSFNLRELPTDKLPFSFGKTKRNTDFEFDAQGVPIKTYRDKKQYHPVQMAYYGLHLIDVYQQTGDEQLIPMMEHLATKFIGLSLELDSALFVPYPFDFHLHRNREQTLFAPWYSSMCQGLTLAYFVRLHRITNDSQHLETAHRLFRSFSYHKVNDPNLWTTCIDREQHLWLEEYPMDLPCLTLNGMNFAIYGLYDYHMLVQTTASEALLKGALTTIKHNLPRFRNPNNYSWYCLKHKEKRKRYHEVHIRQLRYLYKMSGDPVFRDMGALFQADSDAFEANNPS